MAKIVVCGGGGFIGGHLVADLIRQGADVRSVDVKPIDEWFQVFDKIDNQQLDLREKDACEIAVRDADQSRRRHGRDGFCGKRSRM